MSQATSETLIAMATETGFRVYAPADPSRTYLVSGTADVPVCTCSEFTEREQIDPDFRCRHILAVESQLPHASSLDEEERDERRAIQNEAASGQQAVTAVANNGAQMVIKRSASPDGRIDSLSVEFTCPVAGLTPGAITARAERTIRVQDEILGAFLEEHQREPQGRREAQGNGSSGHDGYGNGRDSYDDCGNGEGGAVEARLTQVGGMQTRFGWRMFIAVQVGSKTHKLFGTRRDLADAITNAGYPDLSQNVSTGTRLDVPCRVTLKPSEDGRYQNVERVFPAGRNGSRRR